MTLKIGEMTDTAVLLKWNVPFDGNDPILYFTVTHNRSSGKTVQNISVNQLQLTVENLKPYTSYRFQVTATNELGTSDPTCKIVTTPEAGASVSF